MKTIILAIFAALAICTVAGAGDFTHPVSPATIVYTNTVVSSNTALVASASYTALIDTRYSRYLTIQQFYTTNGVAGTNSIVISRTVDGSNYINCGGWTNGTGSASGEYTAEGKWAGYKLTIVQPTNTVLRVSAMAE